MTGKFRWNSILAGFVLVLFVVATGVNADLISVESNKDHEIQTKITSLSKLLQSIDRVTANIEEKNRVLSSPAGQGRERSLRQEIQNLSQQLSVLERNFNDLAAEVNFDTVVNPEKPKSFNWSDELKDVLGPLIREIQRATSKPREVEKHRTLIETYDFQLENIGRAKKHLNSLLKHPGIGPKLKAKLSEAMAVWEERQGDVEAMKSISTLRLDKFKKEAESLSQTVQKIPGIFFKSHGRNLLIAMFFLVLSIYGFYKLFYVVRKYSPFHKDEKSFYSRTFDLSYTVISALLCLVVVLAVFYFCSDWVLLSIALLFLIGVIWTSKTSLPKAWTKARLILNLGPVREGELVVYRGIPYKVATINMYTLLYNPDIPSGRIRLPISDLETMRSRPVDKNEPWFPSKVGDIVLFKGEEADRLACVLTQTPETVLVEFSGGGRQAISSTSYISSPPLNLSSGFRARFVFPLDYSLQDKITTEIPVNICSAVENRLVEAGFKNSLINILSEFSQTTISSLNFEILADFNGDAAADYLRIKRIMQMACVDASSHYGWSIPINPVTVSMADKH